MLALSSGTGLFGNFKRIDLQGEGDLFGQNAGGSTVTNNVFNIGNVQGGAVSLGGDSHNTGHANNTFTGDQVQKIGIQLDGIEEYLKSLSQNDADIGSVIDLIAEAKSKPNPEILKSIVSMVKEGTDFSDHVVRLGGNVEKLVGLAAKLLPYIPL